MNGVYFADDSAGVFQSLHVPDFGITWAGANPFGAGFCFGSETGCLVFTDATGRFEHQYRQASESGEAINGVALSQNWLAVTTRKDINFIGPWQPGLHHQGFVIPSGAHDVVVAPSGYFVMPLGRARILFIKPGTTERDPVMVSSSDIPGLNFCRVLALPTETGNDLIVCAGRRGGVGITEFREGAQGLTLTTVKFDDLDIVDVCSISTNDKPLAVAAVGRDGSLILCHDILNDKKPQTLKFNSVRGAVYRILSVRGDVYLLTSQGLFALFQLANRFHQSVMLGTSAPPVLWLPIEAADANVVDNQWLLAVGVDDVYKFDVQKMPRTPEEARPTQGIDGEALWQEPSVPVELDVAPTWEQSGFEQKSRQMAMAR